MRLTFRQGIVRCPSNFLEFAGEGVNIVVPAAESVIITFADGTSNYVLTERLSVAKAWSGPFPTSTSSFWLYWDLNSLTGLKTYGYTTVEPIEAARAPVNPADDQHWYDTVNNKLMVWNATAARWQQRIRVFAARMSGAGKFTSMSINSPVFTGTQTGSKTAYELVAGELVFDADGKVLKRANGTFFTTEDVAVTGVASSSQIKINGLVLEAEAIDNIPAFTMVQFSDFKKIKTANNDDITAAPYGITNQDAKKGDFVNVAVEGSITNINWDWSDAGINAPLYVDQFGQLTHVRPQVPVVIARVIDRTTIILNPSNTVINQVNGGGSGGLPVEIGMRYQVLGVNAGGDALEYKSIAGADGITIENSPARVKIGIGVVDCGKF